MSQYVNSNGINTGEPIRVYVKALKNAYLFELFTMAGYVIFTILAVAIFRENFIVLFIFNPMFYAFSSGQRQPYATRIGDLFNEFKSDFQIDQGVTYDYQQHRTSSVRLVLPDGSALIAAGQNGMSSRNDSLKTNANIGRRLKKVRDSEVFSIFLMLSMASLFVYFIDINGWLIRQCTVLGNDEIMLYASLFIVVSCMALDPSLIICRIMNYYETSLFLNGKTNAPTHTGATLHEKLRSFLRRACYLYSAPIITKSKHMNVFLDQVEHIFIGNTDVIRAENAPETFNRLREAGCRFWLMSEGEEKSVMEIARYSGLLVTNLKIKKIIVEESHDEEIQAYLHNYEKLEERENIKPEVCYSSIIVLDGETYAKLAKSKKSINKVMQWISKCKAFVGCHLDAEQKADILEKVGNCLAPEALTLAIGRQTEDSLMMKKAHISVGTQKYLTDDCEVDYVIQEFRTLNRLLLLHGMSSQRRMFHLRCFILFESAALRTVQFIWVLCSFVPELMSSIEIFGHATIYYVNWLIIVWDVLFWIAAFLIYGPFYKYRGPNRKQRRPRDLITRISRTRLYINASLKILMTFLGVALGTIIFSFTVKTFQVANCPPTLEAALNDTLPIPDHDYVTIDYLTGTNLMIILCFILAMETRGSSSLFAFIPVTGYATYWFFKSLSVVVITLPHGLVQNSAASSLLKLSFSYWKYAKKTFENAWFLLTLGIIFVIVALIFLIIRSVFRQFRRKKYYNTHYSRRLVVGDRKSGYQSQLSNFKNFCSYKLYPEVYRVYIAVKTFLHFTGHLIKIYFKYKMRTALCIIAVLQLMVFDNFWYIVGSIFGLTVPLLISLYELIKKKCSPGRAVRRSLTILNRKKRLWEERGLKHVKAGDIILLKDGEMVPADAILLYSSDGDKCKFDQSYINGITKLSTCQALQLTESTQAPEEICNLLLDIKLQDPWKQTKSRFEAVIIRRTIDDDGVPQFASTITSEVNWLLGGYRVKGTQWAISLVVYDDHESKIYLDTKMYRKLIKKRIVEEFQYLGRFLLGLFTFFLFILLVYTIIRFFAGHIKTSNDLASTSDGRNTSIKTLYGLLDSKQTSLLSYLLGLIKIIPTPLLAILSFVRLFETELEINRDITMNCRSETTTDNLIPDKSCFSITSSKVLAWVPQAWKTWLSETFFLKIPTRVKSSSLNAFLGRVESVFIEKSGVLTKTHGNEYVNLKRCSAIGTKVFDLTDETLALDNLPEEIDKIFTVLAISKDAYTSADLSNSVNSSQFDVEMAFAQEVAQFGYEVKASGIGLGHPNSTYTVASSHEHKLAVKSRGVLKSFRFLYRLPIGKISCFIVRDVSKLNDDCQNERTLKNQIYAIGDPEELRKLLQYDIPEQTEEHMSDWTKEGFSTLSLVWRDITLGEFKNFLKSVNSNSHTKERVFEEFLAESFNFLGSIGYYDGRNMIRLLHAAKCRIAILTGDAMDYSKLRKLCSSTLQCDYKLHHFEPVLDQRMDDDADHLGQVEADDVPNPKIICLNGETWEKIFYRVDTRKKLEKKLKDYSWFIGYNLKAHHKKELLDLISKNVTPAKITMAIGNGLGDVPMLRRAHIGVVVRGKKPGEDVKDQADYVIGELRFLKRLLHHGVLGKRNSFKLENVLWYEILMFNLMPFVWYTTAILVAGNQPSNLPFGESYTLPFLGAMAIVYALIVYWNKRKVDAPLISDERFTEEYVISRDHGRSNTLFYLIMLGMAQCLGVKIMTLLLFYAWKPSASIENEMVFAYLAFMSFVEVTYHTCIQSGLLAYLILKGKRRLIALLPLTGWFIYLWINSASIRQEPLIPEALGFSSFVGRFLLGLACIVIAHGIVIYIMSLVQRARKTNSTPQKVFSSEWVQVMGRLSSIPTMIRRGFQGQRTVPPQNESNSLEV